MHLNVAVDESLMSVWLIYTLQCDSFICCNVLQCDLYVCCNALQCDSFVCCSVTHLYVAVDESPMSEWLIYMLQCVAV